MSPAQKMAAYRERLDQAGLKTVSVVVPKDKDATDRIGAAAAALRREYGRLLPEETGED